MIAKTITLFSFYLADRGNKNWCKPGLSFLQVKTRTCHLLVNCNKLAITTKTGKNSKCTIKLLLALYFNRRHFKAQVTAINDEVKWNIDHYFNNQLPKLFQKLSVRLCYKSRYVELLSYTLLWKSVYSNPVDVLQNDSKCNVQLRKKYKIFI